MDMFEEAKALSTTMKMCELTQEALAEKLGVSQSYIANKLRLLKLEENERRAIVTGGLSERHARAILRLPSARLQSEAIARAAAEDFTVAMTEEYVDLLLSVAGENEKDKTRELCFRRLRTLFADCVKSLSLCGFTVRKSEAEDESAWIFSLCVGK